MTKYDPRKNAEGYNDPTPYAAEKHMMAQIRGKQARVAGGYFENIISASCDYYLSRGLAKIEKTPEPMKPLGAKNRKGQFLACYTKQAQPDYGGTLKGGRSIYFEAKHTDDERRTIGVSVTAKSTLAATNPVATALYVTSDGNGELVVAEMVPQVPGQMNMDGTQQEAPKLLKLVQHG